MRRSGMMLLVSLFVLALAMVPNVSLAAAPEGNTVTVNGHAEMTVVPDIAVFSAGIITTADDVEAARKENNRIMNRVISAIVDQGVDRTKITTSQLTLQPIYSNDPKAGAENKIKGYQVQNNVTVSLDDLTKIGTVIDKAFDAGANQFQGLRFGLKDDGAYKDELLKKAVLDGRRKASIITQALGVELGRAVSVTESGSYYSGRNEFDRVLKAGVNGTPIEAGVITLSVDVNMAFAISQY